MSLVISLSKAQRTLAENVRARRLAMELTQEGLSKRSGVPLPTLRKFEQHGVISLGSFLKLLTVIGGLEETVKATVAPETPFTSIDDVLKDHDKTLTRKRGRRT